MRPLRHFLALLALLVAAPAASAQTRVTPIPGLDGAADALVAGPDGAIWASLPADPGRIARITPAGGVVHAGVGGLGGFPPNGRPSGVTSLRGALWLAFADGLAWLRPGTPVTTVTPRAGRPTSLAAGADGALWMTAGSAIARVTPDTLELTYPLAGEARAITAAPDGALWFVEGSRLGRITPAGALTYRPVAGASPSTLASDATGAVWYAQGAVVHRLDDPEAYATGARVTALTSGPDGALWAAVDGGVARIVPGQPVTVTSLAADARAITSGADAHVWVALDRPPYLVKLSVAPAVSGAALVDGAVTATVNPNGLEAVVAVEVRAADGAWRAHARTELYGTTSATTVRLALPQLPPGEHAVRLTATSAAGSTSSSPLTVGEPVVVPEPIATATATPLPNVSPTPTAAPVVPAPSPAPGPVEGRTVAVEVVSGTVGYRAPDAKTYTRLRGTAVLPLGVLLDTTDGRVRVSAQVDGATQRGTFNGGKFSVTQTATGVTELALAGPLACSARERATASTLAKQRKKKRSLWGKDSGGSFRTRGNGSVATVRGTEWRTEDTCAGTTVYVREGAVSVWPRRGGRSTLVRAGQRLFSPRPG